MATANYSQSHCKECGSDLTGGGSCAHMTPRHCGQRCSLGSRCAAFYPCKAHPQPLSLRIWRQGGVWYLHDEENRTTGLSDSFSGMVRLLHTWAQERGIDITDSIGNILA